MASMEALLVSLAVVLAAACAWAGGLAALAKWLSKQAFRMALSIVRLGPVPRHVAFIMDGNRRFAKKLHVKPGEGHKLGFERLEQTLDWCMQLGIKVVTVYAFSIENFKRPQEEVDTLMNLAQLKFAEMAEKSELVKKNGISVRVIGKTDMLPPHVYRSACSAIHQTSTNTNAILNICCPYTSQHEILAAIKGTVDGVHDGMIEPADIDQDTLEQCLFTGDCPPLDILVRTSGESRLSDFMLWQAAQNCHVHFLDILWPEFSFWHMLPILLRFQADFSKITASRERHHSDMRRIRASRAASQSHGHAHKASISSSHDESASDYSDHIQQQQQQPMLAQPAFLRKGDLSAGHAAATAADLWDASSDNDSTVSTHVSHSIKHRLPRVPSPVSSSSTKSDAIETRQHLQDQRLAAFYDHVRSARLAVAERGSR
ncbi:putative undecaprenyl diphosphate synthase-domain-containing protein [Entophlyctis helioformis]|nr:putative undecaprenyl diphosphate synthase-domain-containing protein [Entophlyctis helioformis]